MKKLRFGSSGRGLTALTMGLMFLLVFLVYFTQVPAAHPWGWGTHQFIASEAIELMPDNLDWFFSAYSSIIIEYSVKPDQWKGSDPNESYRHWYHVNHPHDESQSSEGVLPWAVEDNFNMFVQLLRENNWDRAAQLAGAISHYIGDASNPLHATSDYDPGGNHVAFESTVNHYLDEVNMDMPGFVLQELQNVFDSTMQLLDDSYSYTSILNPYLSSDILWNDEIKDITEERLRASAQLHANIWYTGMIRATTGPTSSVDSITPYWQASIPFTITATASAGVQSVSLYYRHSINDRSWDAWTFFDNDTSPPYSWSFTAPQGNGYYEFYSIARDGDGNVESPPGVADARCGLDRAAPASSVGMISPYWRTSTSIQITAMASDATSGVGNVSLYYRYSTDNSSWGTWALHGTDNTAPWEWSFIAPSGSGHYEFYSIAVDQVGNVEQAPTEADARCGVEAIVRGVEVTIYPGERTGSPGETLTFTVTVKNTVEVEDSYDLTVGENAGWGAWLDENLVTIPAGENTMLTVSVTVPSDAGKGDQMMISVTATSRGDPTKDDSATCTATAGEKEGLPVLPIGIGAVAVGGAVIALLLKRGMIYLHP